MNNKGSKGFKFPTSLLNQINECSGGFMLFIINDKNEFEVFQCVDSPVSHLGMINFIEIFSTNMQEALRNKPIGGINNSQGGDTPPPISPDEEE